MGDVDTPIVGAVSAAAVPTWRAAYSDRTAAVMARMCELAYESADLPTLTVPDKNAAPAPAEARRSALETKLAAIGFTLAAVFTHASTQAYLAVSPEFAVLAFRGTANLTDWGIDIDALMTELVLPNGRGAVRVHEGFLGAYKGCEPKIEAGLAEHVGDKLGLYITGHSLGGALAQIASASLERDTLAACYTFGSPRVGEAEFDAVVKCPHYRVVDHYDVVPTVPPPFYRGYLHSGDPRLVRQGVTVALRRERGVIEKLATNAVGLAALLATHKALIVQDHMIGRYRAILEVIACDRQGPGSAAPSLRTKPMAPELIAGLAVAGGLAAGFLLRGRRRRA